MRLALALTVLLLGLSACNFEGCGPGKCNGCCDASGSCVSGTGKLACGSGGGACVECGPTQTCSGGLCSPPSPPCGASNCAGCCVDTVSCVAGTSNVECGTGGVACAKCTTSQSCSNGACR